MSWLQEDYSLQEMNLILLGLSRWVRRQMTGMIPMPFVCATFPERIDKEDFLDYSFGL